MVLMRLKLYAIMSILSLILTTSLLNQDADASELNVIQGKLTASCGSMPFGGEEVGSFEIRKTTRGFDDWIEFLRIDMKEPPSKGEYLVGFMDIGSRPSKLPEAVVEVDEYRDNGRVMIVRDKSMPSLNSVLFVAERDPKDLGLQWSFINIVGTAYLVPPIDSFPKANKFEYKNATIIHTLDVAKNEYKVGEKLELKPKLINIGNQTVRIIHGHPLFIINAYDSSGKAVWVDSGIILTIGISAELKPGVPYGGSEYNLQKGYDIMFCKPGEYKIVSYADFSIEEKAASFHNLKIYSEPVTIKVGTPAQQSVIWSKLYDGSDIGERIGSVISHDLRGNIYAAGITSKPSSEIEYYQAIGDDIDALLLKYNSNGTLVRSKTVNNGYSEEYLDLVAAGKHVYLAGAYNIPLVTNNVLFLQKYSNDGTLLWNFTDVRRAGAFPKMDRDAGNVYMTSVDSILKFSSDGKLIWDKKIGENYFLTSIDVYGGYVYVAGNVFNSGNGDIVLQKYDKDGNLIWSKTWNRNISDGVEDIKLYYGKIYLTGLTGKLGHSAPMGVRVEQGTSMLLQSYSTKGELLWTKTWNSTVPEYITAGQKIEVYKNSIYVLVESSEGKIIQKYDLKGNLVQQFIPESCDVIDLFIWRDSIYVTGATGSLLRDMCTQKYNIQQWKGEIVNR